MKVFLTSVIPNIVWMKDNGQGEKKKLTFGVAVVVGTSFILNCGNDESRARWFLFLTSIRPCCLDYYETIVS
jgi:hypothetical protein